MYVSLLSMINSHFKLTYVILSCVPHMYPVADLDGLLEFLQKPPFSLQFIYTVHGLSYIKYLNIQIILLPVFVTPPLFINNTSALNNISNCHMCLHGFKYILLLHYSQGVEGLHLPTIILIKLTLCI